jgi:hypothetical protein
MATCILVVLWVIAESISVLQLDRDGFIDLGALGWR